MGHGHGGHGHHGHGGGGRWNDWGFFGLPYPFGYPYGVAPAVVAPPLLAPAVLPYRAPLSPYAPYGGRVVTMGQDEAVLAAVPVPVLAAPVIAAPLGFRSRKIRGHKTRHVVACADTPFQPLGLFIPRHVARHFEIKEIRVAGICLLSSRNSIPAEYFSNEGCVGPGPIQFPPILPGQRVEMRVKNLSGNDHHFRAALPGTFIY